MGCVCVCVCVLLCLSNTNRLHCPYSHSPVSAHVCHRTELIFLTRGNMSLKKSISMLISWNSFYRTLFIKHCLVFFFYMYSCGIMTGPIFAATVLSFIYKKD